MFVFHQKIIEIGRSLDLVEKKYIFLLSEDDIILEAGLEYCT